MYTDTRNRKAPVILCSCKRNVFYLSFHDYMAKVCIQFKEENIGIKDIVGI